MSEDLHQAIKQGQLEQVQRHMRKFLIADISQFVHINLKAFLLPYVNVNVNCLINQYWKCRALRPKPRKIRI